MRRSPGLHGLDCCGNQIVFDLFSRKPFANERARRVLRCNLDLFEAGLSQHLLQVSNVRAPAILSETLTGRVH